MRPELVVKIRYATGLSQDGLGEVLGVAGRTVRRWEAGDTEPSRALCIAMAALGRYRGLAIPKGKPEPRRTAEKPAVPVRPAVPAAVRSKPLAVQPTPMRPAAPVLPSGPLIRIPSNGAVSGTALAGKCRRPMMGRNPAGIAYTGLCGRMRTGTMRPGIVAVSSLSIDKRTLHANLS